jgi:hypothetical protein
MRNVPLILFGFFLSVAFCSCNNPLNKTYHSSTYLDDITEIRESNKVSYDDIEILTKYITLSKLAGNAPEGKTYEEILNKIKDIRQANTDQDNRLQIDKDARRERLSSYLTVNLSEKFFSRVKNKDCFIYSVTFNNLSPRNIQMVIGSISLNDLLDREVKTIQIVLDEKISPHSFLKKSYTAEYDHNNVNDQRNRSKELIDLRVVWNPLKIIFEDGTVAE